MSFSPPPFYPTGERQKDNNSLRPQTAVAASSPAPQSSPSVAIKTAIVPLSSSQTTPASQGQKASPVPLMRSPMNVPSLLETNNSAHHKYFHITKFAKAEHLQFANFEVILLVFLSQQAIVEFMAKDEVPTMKHIRQGQLVAACIAGDEKAYARHVPVFGLLHTDTTWLEDKVEQLVNDLRVTRKLTSRQCSVWQAGNYDVYCGEDGGQHGFEQLAHQCAELGEQLVHQSLYKFDNSPHLHASEGRRMTFSERWSYATVEQGHSPVDGTSKGEWIRKPDDDTLLPCISIEWAAANEKIEGESWSYLYSKTGYCIELSSKPQVIILNRHYPHYRRVRCQHVQYVQLVPPSIDLTRDTVKNHQVNGSRDRGRSFVRQLQCYKEHFEEARQGFYSHPSMAQAALSHLSSFILEKMASPKHSKDDSLESVLIEIAQLSKETIQNSSICRYGSAPVYPTADALSRLLYTSFRCLKETFKLTDKELKSFATAMFNTMSETMAVPCVSDELVGCFLITSRLALANTAPLCGKLFKEEEQYVEHFMEEEEGVVKPFPLKEVTGKKKEEESMKVEPEKETSKAKAEDKKTKTPRCDSEMSEDLSESDFDYGPQEVAVSDDDDDVYVNSDMRDVDAEESPTLRRKRSSEEPLAQQKAKQARIEKEKSSSPPVRPTPGSSGHEVDGDLFKKLLQRIMSRDTDKRQSEHLNGCAGLFKTSVEHELIGAKPLSQEAMKTCKTIIQDKSMSNEARCLLLMVAVDGLCKSAEKEGDNGDWDWIILTLAHQAFVTVTDLAKKAEDAYRDFYTSSSLPASFRQELKSKNDCKVSTQFVDVLDHVRDHLETVFSWKNGGRNGTNGTTAYLKAEEINRSLVKALVGQVKLGPSSNDANERRPSTSGAALSEDKASPTETRWKGSVPRVYMNFINLASHSGKKVDRSAARYRDTVFDVLFQIYFTPLIRCLTFKDMDGHIDTNEKNKVWVMQRRFLKFRLQLIDKLVDNCKLGTAVFAARSCSDLVFAPARYLPLPKEKNGAVIYQAVRGYLFPSLVVKRGKYVMEADTTANWQGWEALYSSLRAVKDDILLLASKKDPRKYMTPQV